jgi:uncharacterized membrane protein HdeD (DUF308 family)
MNKQSIEARRAAKQISRWWWAWLVMGIAWIIASLIILRFTTASIVTVGIIIGVLFLVSGIEQFVVAWASEGWQWLWIIFGIILVIGGGLALFNPVAAFFSIADILGFVFVLIGVMWTVEAFATQRDNPLWWLGLIAGILMIILGFIVGTKVLSTKAYYLLIFAGVWTLLHGITDIIKAFQIKRLGSMVAA